MSSFPTCQVCHKQFSLKGPVPFLLPCLHAVCETCVTSAAGGVISCSPCQRDINLTETRIHKDEVREKQILHLTVKNHPEMVLCTHEDDGNQAVCWCKQCEDFLCEHCQMVHNNLKVTKKHTIYKVGEIELWNLVTDRYCSVHPKFMIDTWDKDCSMLTCGRCRFGDHAGHELVDVEKAAETARREIASFGKEIRSTDDQHKANLSAAETDLQSFHKRGSILDGKISFVFNSLKVLLDQREKELKVDLQTEESNVTDPLNAKKNTLEICHEKCQITSDYINNTLKYSSLYDILELRLLLEEKSQDCRSSTPSEDYKFPPLPVFNTDGLERIKSTLAHFGTITTGDIAQPKQMQDSGTQTEEDVMKELERLTQELKHMKASQEKIIKQEQEVETNSAIETDEQPAELKECFRKARRLQELFRGRFSEKEALAVILDRGGDLHAAVDFIMKGNPEQIRKFVQDRDKSLVHELQRDGGTINDNLRSGLSCTVRQFACRPCDNMWWRKVPSRKEVSTCRKCTVEYRPVPRDKEWGFGEFRCPCGNTFWGKGQMGIASKTCFKCSRRCGPYKIEPPDKPRNSNKHMSDYPDCYMATDYDGRGGGRGRGTIRTTNSVVKYQSHPHRSTGSTVCTFLTQDDLDSYAGSD